MENYRKRKRAELEEAEVEENEMFFSSNREEDEMVNVYVVAQVNRCYPGERGKKRKESAS